MTIKRELYGTDPSGVARLAEFAIAEVKTVVNNSTKYPRGQYSERPLQYMVKLKGESTWRRVYATPIGNVSVIYLKNGKNRPPVYCDTALEQVLIDL